MPVKERLSVEMLLELAGAMASGDHGPALLRVRPGAIDLEAPVAHRKVIGENESVAEIRK